MNTEKVRQYFWFVFGAMGAVFMWAGIWDGIGYLSILKIWWVDVLLGLGLFALPSLFSKENILFGGRSNPVLEILHKVNAHPEKHLFNFQYVDNLSKRTQLLSGQNLKRIEKKFLVFLENNQERFIPVHRLTEILHKGKTHWKQ